MMYAVIRTGEKPACISFQDKSEAINYLEEAWSDTINEAYASMFKKDIVIEDETFHEEEYAVITRLDGRKTEFFLLPVFSTATGT